MNRSDMPHNRRCVKIKWIFKIKRCSIFRARLVTYGYSQIAGIDSTENHSPVINDVIFRLMLFTVMYLGLTAKIVNVKTAFLYGEIEEEIFMEYLSGMEGVTKENVLGLTK